MKMKIYVLVLALLTQMPSINSYSQSITDYQNCTDYFGGVNENNNPVNVEFMNRIFGTNYTSIPGSCGSCNPGLITDNFLGCRKTTCGDAVCTSTNTHKGLDIRSAANTNVYAPLSGTVRNVDASCGGRLVIEDDSDPNLKFYFLHMNTISVSNGMHVSMGDLVGQSGVKYAYTNSSGQIVCTTVAEHLHAEIRHYSSNAPKAQSTCVACIDNYDPRLIVLLHPRAYEVNDRLDIYAGSVSNKKQIKVWFRLPGINDSTFTVQNCYVGSYDVSQNILYKDGCNGVGQITIDFPNVTTNGLANTTYDIHFEINGSANKFQGYNQIYLLDPNSFNDVPSQDIWHFPYVRFGIEEGFFKGIALGNNQYEFDGAGLVTRGQAAKVVFMAANKLHLMEVDVTGNVLQNLSPTHWSFPFMQTLFKNGVISDGRPDDLITTGQFAKMLVNALSLNTNDENDGTLNNNTGRTQSNTVINSSDQTLQQYLEIVNKIMLYTSINNSRGYLEPAVNGLMCVSNSQLNGSLVAAVGSNTLSRDLMAKTIVNIYKYKKDKIGNYQPCYGGPQFLNIFNNNFSKFTVIGDKFELTSTPTGSINVSTGSATLDMESGEVKDFGLDNDILNGYNLHFYWCVDSGQLVSLYPNNNHKKVRFTAPNVNAPTPVTLYLYIGCGNGMAKEAIYNITVYPQGQSPSNQPQAPTIQAAGLYFTYVDYDHVTVNWSRGNGEECLLTCTPQGNTIHTPQDGQLYNGNANFTVAQAIQNGSATRVIYDGTNDNRTTIQLTPGSTYTFKVYEYNSTSTANTRYLLSSPASGTVTLPVLPPFDVDIYWDDNPVIAGQQTQLHHTVGGTGINETWTFQGGTPPTSTDASPSVTFANAGNYTVKLVAENYVTGQIDSVTKTVTVLAANAVNPDFVVSNLSLPATTLYAGQSGITTNITFSNIGLIDGQVNNYRIYLSSNNVYDAGDTQIGIRTGWASALIPPGQSLATTHNITIPGGTATGTWYILVYTDFDNTVIESNEANNVGIIQVTVVAGLPDFTYTALALSRSTVATYDTLTITSTLKNQGFNPPGGSSYISTNIYISSNNTWEETDTLLSELGLQVSFGIPYSNQSENLVHGARIPPTVKSGNYYIIITADIEPGSSNDNMYAELNETNNYRAIPITISNPTQPTAAPSNIQVLNITPTTCRIAWTNGNGAKRMVVLAENQTSFYWNPPIDKTSYTANSNYSLAGNLTTIPVQGKIVFSNTGSFVDVTNLAPNATYTVNVFEYNGTGSTSDYLLENYLKPVLFKTADTSQVTFGWNVNINSPTNNDYFSFRDVQFLNDSVGYACDIDFGVIASTKTGGAYWQLSKMPEYFSVLHFINAATGIASGSNYINPFIYKTVNGGNTWIKTNFPIVTIDVQEVYMLSSSTWFVVGVGISPDTSGYLYRTVDAGNSFQLVLSTANSLRGIDFVSTTKGFLVGGYRRVFVTNDMGGSWSLIHSGQDKRFTKVDFTSEQIGYAITQDSIYKTTNGGYAWLPIAKSSTISGTAVHLSFLNDNLGYLTTNVGQIAKTENGGATWSYFSGTPFCTSNVCKYIYATSIISETKVWVAGDWIYYSETGGLTYGIDKPTLSLNPICTGFSMQVSFTKTGTFNPGNVFTVQLSDSAGNFDAPLNLGTLTSVNGGTVTVGIPNGVKESSAYRIRIVSSNPVSTSSSSNNLTVYQKPVPSISVLLPTQYYLNSSPVTLSSYGNPGGGYFTINSNTVTTLNPASLGVGTHAVRYYLSNGPCVTFAEKTITVIPAPLITITQPTPTTVCPGSNISFNYTSTSINAGNTFSVQLSDKNGSFTNPTTIYTLSGNSTSGSIAAAIPVIAVKGNGYRIRMTANSPSVTSSVSIAFTIDTLLVPSVSIQATSMAICTGQSVTFTISTQNAGSSPQYQWFLNNLPTGNNSSSYTTSTLNNQDEVSLRLTSSAQCALPAIANAMPITMQVNPSVTPAVYIIADDTGFCSGSPASFAAYSSNEGNSPTYHWKVNGVVAGSNTAYFSSTSLTNGNKVSVTLTSSEQCLTAITATDSLYANILPLVTPTISIAADNPNNCNNQLTNFTATTTNAGNSPVFVWKSNGTIVGTNSNTYDNVFLTGGEVITCQLASSICASPNPVTSNAITVPTSNSPAVIGFPQGPSTACVGDISTYTASPGGSTSISWSVNNGTIISGQGTTSVSILWQQAGNTAVTVVGTNICGSAIVNQEKMVAVGAPSDIAITTNNSTVCDNTSPVFTAAVTSPGTNSVYQWKLNGANVGSSTNTYTLPNPTTGNTVSCIYTSTNACSSLPNDTSNVITVTTLQSPANPAVTMIPSVWCDGNPTYLQASSCIGCTYQWNQSKLIPTIGLIVVPLNGNGNMVSVGEIQPGFTVNVTVTNANGCSSSTSSSFQATQLPNSASIITATTCQNNPYNFNGTNIASSGSFTDTLQSANGCDSVITLNLTVLPAYTTIIEESICAGTSYYFKGQNIVAAGVYLDTLQSSSSCDSIIQLILTVNNPSASSINASICQGSSYFFNNQDLTTAGTYTDTLLNSLSCDSIITLFLSVDVPPAKPTITVIGDTAFCFGDSAILQTTNTAGTLLWNTNETTSSITVTAANIYNVQVTNQCGNAMSDNQQISVFALPTQPAIIQNADTLTSSILANSYQWYHNQAMVNGATTQSIVPAQNGDYVVEITDVNGCKNTSAIYIYTSVGLSTALNALSVEIIPNPNTGQFMIQFSDNLQHNVSITDVLGRLLAKETVTGQKQVINQSWMDGVYFLNVFTQDQTRSLKFIIAK